jgi:hypothetical protein
METFSLFESSSLLECAEHAKLLVEDNEDRSTVEKIVQLFIEKVASYSAEDCSLHHFHSAAECLRDISLVHSCVGSLVVAGISDFSVPKPFIDVLPSMFSISEENVVENLAIKLFEIVKSNKFLLLHVLNTLMELPHAIGGRVASWVTHEAVGALQDNLFKVSVYPQVLRVLLKSVTKDNVKDAVNIWRKKVNQVFILNENYLSSLFFFSSYFVSACRVGDELQLFPAGCSYREHVVFTAWK